MGPLGEEATRRCSGSSAARMSSDDGAIGVGLGCALIVPILSSRPGRPPGPVLRAVDNRRQGSNRAGRRLSGVTVLTNRGVPA